MDGILATDFLDIDYAEFEKLGVFDSVLNKDSNFFINVVRLKEATTIEFIESYTKINNCFTNIAKLLKKASIKSEKDRFYRETINKFKFFDEVNVINLGFAESKHDSGFGSTLSKQVVYDTYDIVKAGITDPEIFHLIGLFEKNVGPDRLSDMIATIILKDIENYTKRIQNSLQIDKVNYPDYDFDRQGFLLNPYKKSRVYFVPKEILHELPIAKCWEDVDTVITENKVIRDELNSLLGEDLIKWAKSSSSDKKDFLKEKIFLNPDLC